MKIVVLSGKGGTGKTTVSTNLFYNSGSATLYDTDVEEPNAHLFFSCEKYGEEDVTKSYPSIDSDLCTLCGKCSEFCNYNALLTAKSKVLVFEESCHDCGGCKLVCCDGAITYRDRSIGKILSSRVYGKKIVYGKLNLGELSGVPIISRLNCMMDKGAINIVDAPPGTSCATFAATEDADYAIVVSEPTPFGVSDMKMVVEMLRNSTIPFGVVINKAGLGDSEIYRYCEGSNIEILAEIPYSKEIAQLYAKGMIFSRELVRYQPNFRSVLSKVIERVGESDE